MITIEVTYRGKIYAKHKYPTQKQADSALVTINTKYFARMFGKGYGAYFA